MNRIVAGALVGWLAVLSLPGAARAQAQPPSATPAAAQAPTPPTTPPATPATTPAATPAPADYSQEPFIVEQFYTTARYENDGTGERDESVRIRVQSDAGVKQWGELVFGYSSANEQADIHFVRVRKADGTVVNAAPDAVKELTAPVAADAPVYTDYKEKHVTVPSLSPGDTVEYEIATRLVTPLAPGEFWFQHEFIRDAIALDERLEINIPSGRALTLESPDFPYDKDSSNGRTIYRWKHANLARPSDDDAAKKKPHDEKPPNVQLTTFASWEAVGRWYAKLEQGRTDPDAAIRAKTQELIAGRANDLDKMQALYNYVSENIRYVSLSFGLGRYQPHAAAEIFANQYGDCKDKVTLLASMLEAAGISSDAVLIPSSRKLDTSMPSPSQFDHVITAAPQGGDLIWMDATAEVAPFRLLTAPLRDKSALLVPADGAGKIVTTPADPPFLSTQAVEIDGQVSDLGKLDAHLHYTLRGDTEFVLRTVFRDTPETHWKEIGATILRLDGIEGDVVSVKPSDPSDTRNPFELEMEFTRANFLDWSSKDAKLALPLVTIGLPDTTEDNTEPIELGSPLDVTAQLKLTLPASFTAQAPVAIAVARDYAEFESSYDFEGHTLTAKRTLNFKMRELPASRTSDYMAFSRAVAADEGQVLNVQNSTTGAPAIPSAAKTDELVEAGVAALDSGNPSAAIPLLQRVVELEPQHKQAWNDLGLAYLRLGQFDDAAGAFQKQIAVNPYDEHSYDYLGATLQEQQKYPEAVDAFRKQLDLNPLDLFAHRALGGLFLSQHEYTLAVPELEKATTLSPDNALLQVSLGTAYINTGEKDKALAAFEKGAGLSQKPVIWNNVAYSLADNKLELDKAQQYAESAISATDADLRNMDLAHLTLDGLVEVESVGDYWDTLGWVYFQKGDLDSAERYIRAAWLLCQHGEVADHLAQVYEKRGQKDQAIHMFALALAAPQPVPETRARLMLLLGGNSTIDNLTAQAKPELVPLRTLPAGKLLKEDAQADFFVLLSPGEKEAHADAAEFVSGSEKLRPFAEPLRALDYGAVFPDASPLKIVRRGTLTCSAKTGDCSFTLIPPEDVRTLN
jgi:tetratricopeptide (TPR) repeat protein/transglutaminase-like putative cysteine protease